MDLLEQKSTMPRIPIGVADQWAVQCLPQVFSSAVRTSFLAKTLSR
jgi:hypothetical protein